MRIAIVTDAWHPQRNGVVRVLATLAEALEALASGVPVAAFPVPGPADVIGAAPVGVLDDDLARAALAALDIAPDLCRDYAAQFSWHRVARQLLGHLRPLGRAAAPE